MDAWMNWSDITLANAATRLALRLAENKQLTFTAHEYWPA
jgi:hypothetical protein